MIKINLVLFMMLFEAFNLFGATDDTNKYFIDSNRFNENIWRIDLSNLNLSDHELEDIFNNPIMINLNNKNVKVDLSRIKHINLNNNNLTKIPEKIFSLNLESLEISNNKLTEISDLINSVRKLVKLNLSNNQINKMPDLTDLMRLEILDLSNNLLKDIPVINTELAAIRKGSKIDFSNNLIEAINYNVFNQVTELNLSNNKIKKIPDFYWYNLKILDLGNNELEEFPDFISALKELYLNNNNIQELDLIGINKARKFPLYELSILDLSFNNLSKDSFKYQQIAPLIKNIRFYLHGNNLKLEDLYGLNIACKPLFDIDKNVLEDRVTCSNAKSVNLSNLPVNLTDLVNLRVKNIDQNDKILWSPLTVVPSLGLDLSRCSLTDTSISSPLFDNLKNLRDLKLDHNGITSTDYLKLNPKSLSLNYNKLKKAVFISNSLESLSLNGNKELDRILLTCPNLISLDAASCNLSDKVIVNSALKLEDLNLSDNKFSIFPHWITESSDLQEIYFGDNQIKDLPADLFVKLPKLRLLDLKNNPLGEDAKKLLEDNKISLESNFKAWLLKDVNRE